MIHVGDQGFESILHITGIECRGFQEANIILLNTFVNDAELKFDQTVHKL